VGVRGSRRHKGLLTKRTGNPNARVIVTIKSLALDSLLFCIGVLMRQSEYTKMTNPS